MWEEMINARQGRNMSQSDLAWQCGISTSRIGSWEKKTPSFVVTLRQICETLEVSPNALLGYQVNEIDGKGTPEDGSTVLMANFTREDLQLIVASIATKESELRAGLSKGIIDQGDVDLINSLFSLRRKALHALGVEEA